MATCSSPWRVSHDCAKRHKASYCTSLVQNHRNQRVILCRDTETCLCRITETNKCFVHGHRNMFCAESQKPTFVLCRDTETCFVQNHRNQQLFCAETQKPASMFAQKQKIRTKFCVERQQRSAQTQRRHIRRACIVHNGSGIRHKLVFCVHLRW